MPSNTVANLETEIVTKGYSITKKYDGNKGICVVTLERKSTATTIVDSNTSKAPMWNAYKRALELCLTQINEFEKAWGKTP